MKSKEIKAFTLAEVLITLAIIGVVAALSIPAVISNSQQQEFKTGLRKAVSVLNSAITMNMALDGESPYDNANLFGYLQKHMSITASFTKLSDRFYIATWENSAFYTMDGMRFELRRGHNYTKHKLYESNTYICYGSTVGSDLVVIKGDECGGCGSYGLNNNPDNTTKPPCLVTVDVNGDKKPNPQNVDCKDATCGSKNSYKFSDPLGLKLTDLFSIMITDKQAIPYGVAAQRAMYQARK